MQSLARHLIALAVLALVAIIALAEHGPIAQDQAYHAFADQRSWLGIPNAADVLSNLPFAIAALLAMSALRRARWADGRDRPAWIAYATTLLLTAMGSAYYHWSPGDERLFWDRLPLSLTMAALAAATLGERLPARWGPWLLAGLLPAAMLATCWWRWTGDLRPYALAQFLPLLLVAQLTIAVPSRYSHARAPLGAVLFYAAAKLAEAYDAPILAALGGVVSGHSLKHVAAALGGWWLVRMVARRTPLGSAEPR
jgi:hypothetical protein